MKYTEIRSSKKYRLALNNNLYISIIYKYPKGTLRGSNCSEDDIVYGTIYDSTTGELVRADYVKVSDLVEF